MPPRAEERIRFCTLKHAKASLAAKLVKDLYGERAGLRVASDERTNTLVLMGQEDQVTAVEAILMRLDFDVPEERGKK